MFSSRVPGRLEANRIAAAAARLRREGREVLDLTQSNPTRVGLPYPAGLLAGLSDPAGFVYRPEPLGARDARRAIAGEYARRGLDVPDDRILLTASTSEAYSFLFRLLCNPGDRVLVPRPGYPLVEHLARLDGVAAVPYPLEYDGRWSIDLDHAAVGLRAGARALVMVSPNNPTGSCATPSEIAELADLCAGTGAALVGDEVFADYVLDDGAERSASVLQQNGALAFALGGLSKAVGLPQIKLAWMAVTGPDPLVRAALERLEYISDAYLSVSTPAQTAAATLLAQGAAVREAIRARLRHNLATIERLTGRVLACHVLRPEGGWSAVLRVPAIRPEADLVLALLEQDHVLVHPGYFFDFPAEAYVVISLLPEPARFKAGVTRLLARAVPDGIQ